MASQLIDIQCWNCGQQLIGLLLPLSRSEECRHCNADLHCCRSCLHFDSSLNDGCREDRAEFINEKQRANFCDYFEVSKNAHNPHDRSEAERAKAQLAALFGDEPPAEIGTGSESSPQTEADRALAELKRLFGDSDDEDVN